MKKKWKIDRSYWLYGLVMGVLLIAMEVIQYKTIVREIKLELAGVIIGALFLALGIWFGARFFNKPNEAELYNADELGLSKREIEVLQLLAEGFSNQEIADKLFVSLNTTKTHISNIYSKLGVSRRTQAVQKARKLSFPDHANG